MQTPDPLPPLAFDDRDRALRRDVGRLGAQLGAVLREAAPDGVYETVEAARLAARRRRKGEAGAEAELEAILRELAVEPALEVVRAFSAYFGAVNTAEQVHRMRRRIEYRAGSTPQPGSFTAVARELAARGVPAEAVEQALAGLVLEPVFTAHPTEVVRRTLLRKDQRLARALVERFRTGGRDPAAWTRLDEAAALELASAWQTEEQLPHRPTVAEEVEHVLFFLSDVLYRVLPFVHEELEQALTEAYGREFRIERPLVRCASWVGGDMDGNPAVGAHTIRATLARHRELALRRYREELLRLHEHLSQSSSRVGVSTAVAERIRAYERDDPEAAATIPARYAEMPYRRLLWLMSARLGRSGLEADAVAAEEGSAEAGSATTGSTRTGPPSAGGTGDGPSADPHPAPAYGPPDEFEADLAAIADSLAAHHGRSAGLALVRRTLLRVRAFGFHLARLDVRQDAAVHRAAVAALLERPELPTLAPEERAEVLSASLATGAAPPARSDDEDLTRSLAVFRALAEARERYGDDALGPAIISMARGADDALAVLLLARAGGCLDGEGRVPLDVVPLLETVDDLLAGPAILRALAADPTYAAHLAARGGRQMVMVGYSDSNKDGGLAASRVAIENAQTELVAAARELGLELVFFHGRGGSISRGGSKPRAGILAAPPRALAGHARATEQGEIVGAKFGLRGIATRTLEVSLGALLERTADPDSAHAATGPERAVARTLGHASRERYRALVHEEPDFPELFRSMTPLDVIERMAIGSRPARRRAMRGVEDLRAIPWVFAWTQTRALLPGWYGVGSGLEAAIAEHGLGTVRAAIRGWPFLSTLVADVQMVLGKSDLAIAARYAELAGDVGARLFPRLADEHARTLAAVLELTEQRHLLEREPTLARSIRLRNPYVDPLSFVQTDALRRWRATDRTDADLERLLVQTVRGIARGLRNTG